MSDLSWSDRELADALEGLLEADVAEALAAEVACDPELAARQAALTEILREPVLLPRLDVPEGLAGATRERLWELPRDADLAAALEGEGDAAILARDPARVRALRATLVESRVGGEEDLPTLSPAPGLQGRILARLEAEGLLAPAPALEAHSDEALADLLEDVLSPGERAAVERDLGRDAALRARLESLRSVLGAQESLAPLPLPQSLSDAVHERLLDEGLERVELPEGANLPVRPPADLLARTLGRLEAAALIEPKAGGASVPLVASEVSTAPVVAPAPASATVAAIVAHVTPAAGAVEPAEPATQGLLLSFPRVLLAAAALLLVGLGIGYLSRPPAAPRDDLASSMAEAEAALARKELAEVEGKLRVAEKARRLAREEAGHEREGRKNDAVDLIGARAEVAQARQDLGALRGELKAAGADTSDLRKSLALARQEGAKGQALLARREGALEELRGTLAKNQATLASTQGALRKSERTLGESRAARQEAETQRALAQTQIEELGRAPKASAAMRVANAAQIERWDADRQSWKTLGPDETLLPGSIVRGISTQSTLQVSGLLPYQLRSGVYVIRDGQRLVPLPNDLQGRGGGSAEPAPDDVLTWIERLQSGSALERSRASQALRAQFYAVGGEGQAPASAAGWNRWWSQARRVARR